MVKHYVPAADPNIVVPAIRNIRRGEKVPYHKGFLDIDRRRSDVRVIADAVYEAYLAGKLVLTQRRLGPPLMYGSITDWQGGVGPGFEYIATGR